MEREDTEGIILGYFILIPWPLAIRSDSRLTLTRLGKVELSRSWLLSITSHRAMESCCFLVVSDLDEREPSVSTLVTAITITIGYSDKITECDD